ncbi:riboflavin kinase [Agromyces mediolanus]|uniref:riboflavin kinase n=1 Tax=Agromyces mediolanus TaxID=41986 RepID=UPI00383258EA
MPSATPADPPFAGVVVGGHGRGRVLGFPTANVEVAEGEAPPVDGVYACWIRFPPAAERFGGTVSVGDNPTFDDVFERRIEAYVHDLDENLYGRAITVEPVAMLREMRRFDSLDELIERTEHDVRRSRALLAALDL